MFDKFVSSGIDFAIKKLKSLDLNHNKKADVEELAALLKKHKPALQRVNDAVDFRLLAAMASNHPAVKDKALFQELLVAGGEILEFAGTIEIPEEK
ncbi:MAG: hypothetical protein LCH63_10300 [Candidatus Melainabacteria bacterium]|nr:hypothetical protein [Candidatus Melainabacteria bacterium]